MAPKLLIVMRPVAGGMWQHLLTLLDGLAGEYEVVVACQDDGEQLERVRSRGLRARIVDMPPTIRPIADVRAIRQLREVILTERPSIVHSHNVHAGLLSSMVCRVAGRPPHVSTLHSVVVRPDVRGMRAAVYRLLERIYPAGTDCIICVSTEIMEELPARARRKAVLIPNGIDAKGIAPAIGRRQAREELGVTPGEKVVGCVGRLAPEKGVDDFLRMAALLANEPIRFVVVGEGPSEDELLGQAKELGLDTRVIFTGFHSPVSDYLQVFDLMVMPSLFEGLPLAAIEALSLGVPVVATEVGGLPELISPDVGALVPPRDPQELARTVSQLLASQQLPILARQGKELVARRYTSDRMVRATRAVYDRIRGVSTDPRGAGSRKLLMVIRPVAGGMWQHLLTLLDGLADEYEVVVACQGDAEQLDALEARGVSVRVVPIPAKIDLRADISARRALRQLIADEEPDIIHSHGFHAGVLVSSALGADGGPAHVCTLHTMAIPPGAGVLKRVAYEILQRYLVWRTPHLIAISEAVRDAVPGGWRPGRVKIVRNGVDISKITMTMGVGAARRDLDIKRSAKVIGCVARLSAEKGVADFVRMAALVAEAVPKAVFVVVGDGPLRSDLESLADELEISDRIRFAGRHVPSADYMRLFDITVVPSISEGQSLVAIESMLLGKPVVATTVGGLVEVVSPDVGKLAPAGQPDALARAVVDVLLGGEANRMGARGKARAENLFRADIMVERTQHVYDRALAARGGT